MKFEIRDLKRKKTDRYNFSHNVSTLTESLKHATSALKSLILQSQSRFRVYNSVLSVRNSILWAANPADHTSKFRIEQHILYTKSILQRKFSTLSSHEILPSAHYKHWNAGTTITPQRPTLQASWHNLPQPWSPQALKVHVQPQNIQLFQIVAQEIWGQFRRTWFCSGWAMWGFGKGI